MKIYQNKSTTARFQDLKGLLLPFRLSKPAVVLFCAIFLVLCWLPAEKVLALTTFTDLSDFNTQNSFSDGFSVDPNNVMYGPEITSYADYWFQFTEPQIINSIVMELKEPYGHDSTDPNWDLTGKWIQIFEATGTKSWICWLNNWSFSANSQFLIEAPCNFAVLPAYTPFYFDINLPAYLKNYFWHTISVLGNSVLVNPDAKAWFVGGTLPKASIPNVEQLYIQFTSPFSDNLSTIIPEYPTDCQYSIFPTSTPLTFNATGTILIPQNSDLTWTKFSVKADEMDTGSTTYFSIPVNLTGGAIYDYSVPVNLPNGAWKISYILQGQATSTPYYSTHYCKDTGVGNWLPLPQWKEITGTEFGVTEDCSSLSPFSVERYICELKNLIVKIFVPSQSSVQSLKNTIDGLSKLAPMNYITATKDFFNDINTGLATTSIDFHILGQGGSVAFAFFDTTTTIAGQTRSIADTIKLFFIFLLVVAFLAWAISFTRKIFR